MKKSAEITRKGFFR